ncbi:hypothetical protein HYX09_03405 [Candidatus Woesearchaeota archaeon]|nr:hypothetical protein [Candidatus Woesearchaeota archaeon]
MMLNSFIERENEIFDILDSFNRAGLKYVLVGGYAVLKARHFALAKSRVLEDIYSGHFECYIKKVKLPVTVDLMIGSIASRQTNASISFAQLSTNSINAKITGIEKTIDVTIPKKELLIALKIHAAMLTDSRDIVALCHDINFEVVEKFIHIGNAGQVNDNLNKLLAAFKSDNFKDAFKGVCSIEKLPKDNIENAIKLMEKLSNQIKP